MGSQRQWFKIHSKEWVNSSIAQEPLEVQGAFVRLMAYAANGGYGDKGVIKLTDTAGIPDSGLAVVMGVSPSKWKRLKATLVEKDRIRIWEHNIISITNWAKYQAEYDRQKPYRDNKKKGRRGPDDYLGGRLGHVVRTGVDSAADGDNDGE